MSSPKVDLLYLSEQDMIDAGVLNMHECMNEMENVFELLSKGDYIMGGKNQNSHGMLIQFPEDPKHEGMPKDGPDRRFMAMPAYLGGDYRAIGVKWYGSNQENIDRELPRSILTMELNDVDTGAPIAYQSANLLSAWRTGAIPGVGARHLANPDSKVFGSVGAGAIATSSTEAIMDAVPSLETIKVYDVTPSTAETLKERINKENPDITVELVDSIEEAVRGSDIINLATTGDANPRIEEDWVKDGALITMSSTGDFDPDFVTNRMKVVVDNWDMYEASRHESEYPFYTPTIGVIGYQFLDWIDEGKMTPDIITDIGDILTGEAKGRESEDDIILYGLGGQPVYDVAWGYRIYQNALEKGIGTKLNLWDRAYQAR